MTRRLAFLALLCALGSFPLLAAKVSTDRDREIDMSGWSTFRWGKESTPELNEIQRKNLERSIREAFEARGMRFVEGNGEVDFTLDYHAVVDHKTQQSSVRFGLGVSHRVGSHGSISLGGSSGPKPKTVEIGTLVLDVRDASTGNLAWTAKATDTLKDDPEKRSAQVNSVLEKALADFPPGPERKKK